MKSLEEIGAVSPRYVRCYDNGGTTADRYTVVFTRKRVGGQFMYLGMSPYPTHPQGIGMHGFSDVQIDRPRYRHLGKKIRFEDLPETCQQVVRNDYDCLWPRHR